MHGICEYPILTPLSLALAEYSGICLGATRPLNSGALNVLQSIYCQSRSAAESGVLRRIHHAVARCLACQFCTPPEAQAGNPLQVTESAFPAAIIAVGGAVSRGDLYTAERLLQREIRQLSNSVPPKSPRLRDWLVLTCLAVLRDDPTSAVEFLQQAERHPTRVTPESILHQNGSLSFARLCLRALVKSVAGQTKIAGGVLDEAELLATGGAATLRMWLVLQLRAAVALQDAKYRIALQAWQAAMLLQRQPDTAFRGPQLLAAEDRNWLADMASRESAVANN